MIDNAIIVEIELPNELEVSLDGAKFITDDIAYQRGVNDTVDMILGGAW